MLIRAVEPLENVGLMRKLRKNPERETNITSGPGKLCMAMSIDKQLNGADFLGSVLWIEDRLLDQRTYSHQPSCRSRLRRGIQRQAVAIFRGRQSTRFESAFQIGISTLRSH